MKTSPMKPVFRIAATALVFLTWATAPVAVAQTDVTYFSRFKEMYAVKRANVRSGPGTNFAKVGLLDVDQKVRVTARRGDWFKLTGLPKQSSRFVYAPLLTEINPLALTGRGTTTASSKRTIKYRNGGRYHGQTRNSRPHGHGVYTQTDGYRHEGEYRDGLFHGHGVLVYANGNRYEGDFVKGKRTGRGVFTWTDGVRYKGDFVDGRFNGRGIMKWPDTGYRHEGHWVDGKRHGEGWEMQADGTGFRATWRNDEAGRRDYRRESWESDRVRWLRESGFETQTASTERKPKAGSSPRQSSTNQASADAKELWGVYFGTWYPAEGAGPSYSIVWNASTPDDALRKALELCQAKMGIPCWPPRTLTYPLRGYNRFGHVKMPQEVSFYSTSSDREPLERLVGDVYRHYNEQARCALVCNAPYDDTDPENDGYDIFVYWGNTPEEVRKQFEEDPRRKRGGARIEVIACNDR